MDEADKYKQRLEAIAEKRRLQEEQDRVRREMEEEKLRLQQLKRKSLRDQWLMEGAPLSPTSLGPQSPHSPLWGSQAQDIEEHMDKLQAEHEHFAAEEEKLEGQMGNGQTEAMNVAEFNTEGDPNGIVPNGGDSAGESAEDNLKMDLSPVATNAADLLTNGGAEVDEGTRSSADSTELPSEHPHRKPEARPGVPVPKDERQPISNVSLHEDEEAEGTLVIRAERVTVTDDAQEEDGPDAAVVEDTRAGSAAESAAHGADADETGRTAEMEDASMHGADGTLDPTSLQVQPPPGGAQGVAMGPLPIYAESTPDPEPPLEAAAAEVLPEGSEAAGKAPDAAALPSHFQDVPLAEPRHHQPEEQEPLLSQTTAPDICSEARAAVDVTCSPAGQSGPGAGRGEDTQAPKHKTCQCCSVM